MSNKYVNIGNEESNDANKQRNVVPDKKWRERVSGTVNYLASVEGKRYLISCYGKSDPRSMNRFHCQSRGKGGGEGQRQSFVDK